MVPLLTVILGIGLSLGSAVIDLTYTFDDKTIYWPTDKSSSTSGPTGVRRRAATSMRPPC